MFQKRSSTVLLEEKSYLATSYVRERGQELVLSLVYDRLYN